MRAAFSELFQTMAYKKVECKLLESILRYKYEGVLLRKVVSGVLVVFSTNNY